MISPRAIKSEGKLVTLLRAIKSERGGERLEQEPLGETLVKAYKDEGRQMTREGSTDSAYGGEGLKLKAVEDYRSESDLDKIFKSDERQDCLG